MNSNTVSLPCPNCKKDFDVKPEDIFDGNILNCPNCNNRFILDVDKTPADEKLRKLKKSFDDFSL